MKNKIIGWVLWGIGLAWPIHSGLLDTENVIYEDGSPNNIKGLTMFILTVVFLFAGYFFYDKGSSPKPAPETSHH